MEAFPRTLDFLGGTALGVFGAGHLGRTVAGCLLRSGFPASRLMVCHGGSAETRNLLAEEGLAANVADAGTLTRSAKLILYLVRPQSVDALASHELRPDALIVSFLAGVPLARLPARIPLRVRVMPSAPATILARNAIAGVFPDGNPVVEELLRGLGFRLFSLEKEDDVHAFTAFGPCLPIVLSMLHGIGGDESDGPILDAARAHGLKGYEPILQWARGAQPVFGSEAQRSNYLKKAATPGGVTEAMLRVIESGGSLAGALDRGVSRSRELSGSRRTKDPSEVVRRTYNELAETYDEWAESVRVEERKKYLEKILNAFPRGAGLLDIGCGNGSLQTAALSKKFEMTGVDISERQISEARRRYPAIRFLRADIGTCGFEPGSFDGVVSFYCFNHVPRSRYRAVFRRIFEWLRPGGLFVSSFGAGDTEGWIGEWLGVETFFSSYGPERTSEILRETGFAIEEAGIETALENGEETRFLWISSRKPQPPATTG